MEPVTNGAHFLLGQEAEDFTKRVWPRVFKDSPQWAVASS